MSIPTLEFITGSAGTGKTTLLRQRIADARAKGKRSYGTLCATTGIAAINLSGNTGDTVTTINSLLKYFDTNSLKDNFACRRLHGALKDVSRGGMNLIVDEVSMMDAIQLDLIYDAMVEVNELAEVFNRGGLGLVLSGDYCQLPPVKADFAFTAKCWDKFKVTKLEKIWRQDNVQYIQALNAARSGDGELCSKLLCEIPDVQLRPILDSHFEGTTIVPINKLVDSINKIRLDELISQGKTVWEFKSFRWGRQLPEWKQVPESRIVTRDSYIMILANDSPQFTYANGSCGWVQDAVIDTGTVFVKLKENNNIVRVRRVTRCYYQKETPEGFEVPEYQGRKEWKEKNDDSESGAGYKGEMADTMYKMYLLDLTSKMKQARPMCPYYNFVEEKWVVGEISYTPIRLGYASTVHRSQGLTLDSVQIDYSHAFFGEPAMSYVSLSRARSPAGLVIVGSRKLIELRTNISSEVLPWI